MSKNIKMILAIAGFTLLLIGAAAAYNALSKQVQPEAHMQGGAAQPAADFAVTDAQGNTVRLSDYRGKPVVLNFWASWCPPCRQEMPEFDQAHEELGDEVQFLMVGLTGSNGETVETASAFIREQGYGFPVFFDTAGKASDAYGVMSIPATFFINAQGNIVSRRVGALSGAALSQEIEGITR